MKRCSFLYAAVLMVLTLFPFMRQGHAQIFFTKQITTHAGDQSETAITVNPLNVNHLMAVWNDFKDAGAPPLAIKSKAG